MKLPTQKKILREDVKEAPEWIDRIIVPVNSFFETVFNGLSRRLTFEENIASQIKEIDFSTTAAYDDTAANWDQVTFAKTIKTRAIGVILLQIIDLGPVGAHLSSYRPIEDGVYVDWIEENEEIIIGLIYGLTPSHDYRVRFLVI